MVNNTALSATSNTHNTSLIEFKNVTSECAASKASHGKHVVN